MIRVNILIGTFSFFFVSCCYFPFSNKNVLTVYYGEHEEKDGFYSVFHDFLFLIEPRDSIVLIDEKCFPGIAYGNVVYFYRFDSCGVLQHVGLSKIRLYASGDSLVYDYEGLMGSVGDYPQKAKKYSNCLCGDMMNVDIFSKDTCLSHGYVIGLYRKLVAKKAN